MNIGLSKVFVIALSNLSKVIPWAATEEAALLSS